MLNKKIAIIFVLLFSGFAIVGAMVVPISLAQCSDCWNTPTPTNTPGTPTPYPVPPSSTVYATPPSGVSLPGPGDFLVPTSIPALVFPPPPSPISPDAIPTPAPLSLTPIATPNYSDTISYTTPISLDFSGGVTDTAAYTAVTGILGEGSGWISSVVSYTGWLSGEVSTLQQTGTFTLSSAPEWYAPDLPRPMADVGWTIEGLQTGIDSGERYSLSTWAWFGGYMVSLPVQLGKVVFQIIQFLGPLGLFVIWLFVMLPYKLWVKFLIFIKNLIISLFNFILETIRFLLDLIGLLVR
jgi:hypothetical protein